MTTTITDTAAPSLSASIAWLCRMLTSGRDDGALVVSGRTQDGFGEKQVSVRAEEITSEWIPVPLLALLEDGDWSLHVGLAARSGVGSSDVARLGALAVRFPVPLALRNPEHPDSPHGRHWLLDEGRLAEVHQRLRAFPIAPTAIVFGGSPLAGGGYTVTALYALDPPMTDERTGLEILRDLARALGADVPLDDARLGDFTVPLPGSRIRESGGVDTVSVPFLEPTRVYTVDQIRAAVRKKETP